MKFHRGFFSKPIAFFGPMMYNIFEVYNYV